MEAGDDDESLLTLSLSSFRHRPSAAPLPPPELPSAPPEPPSAPPEPHPAPRRRIPKPMRRNPTRTPPVGKSETIAPPFPWSGTRRAIVRSLRYLRSKGISQVGGEVQCQRCNGEYVMQFDLEQKFGEIDTFIRENKGEMNQRAPKIWLNPARPNCRLCNERGSVRPSMSPKKKSINWLFLFLGQMVGHCTLKQLKYYLKHKKIHRTGAKDRLVYLTYVDILDQLKAHA